MQKNPKTKLTNTKKQNKNITHKKIQTLNMQDHKTVQYKMKTKQQKSKHRKKF